MAVQVKIELDACDSTTHCISTVPESVEAKRQLPVSMKHKTRQTGEVTASSFIDRTFEYWRCGLLPAAVVAAAAAAASL